MRRLRLLYCIDTVSQHAGPDIQLREMIVRIDPDRFEVHLCCFEEHERLQELSSYCTSFVLPVPSFRRPRTLSDIRRLRAYIDEHNIEVMHTFMVDANILGILAARRSTCRVVISSRRNQGYWMTPWYRCLYRFLNRYTTRLLANSNGVRRYVIDTERVTADKVDVLYNGVDLTRFRPGAGKIEVPRALGIPEDERVVGIVANLRPIKDHALFLRTAKRVLDVVTDVSFLLVGTGPLREELTFLATELGIDGKVYFSDGRGEVIDYLERMDIGCLSSESEGFSNAVLEYMAAGLPVVATDVGGNGEAIANGVNGYLAPHGDERALAESIVELLRDDAKRREMGRRSLERCRERFDISDTVRQHEDYYTRLVAEAVQGD